MKVKLLKDLPGLSAGSIGKLNALNQLVEFNGTNGLPNYYYQSFRIEYVNAHPNFFEIIEENRLPKVGEVWGAKGKNKILLIIYACIELNEINGIKIEPIQEHFWFTYKFEDIEFLAPSLEEYYRMKFKHDLNL